MSFSSQCRRPTDRITPRTLRAAAGAIWWCWSPRPRSACLCLARRVARRPVVRASAGEASDVRVAYPGTGDPATLRELTNNDRVIHRRMCRRRCRALSALRPRPVPYDHGPHRGVGEAHRERVPGRQHRVRERDLAGVRLPGNRSVGADRACQPSVDATPARRHAKVDPWFIAHATPERTPFIQAARQVNSRTPLWVAEQVPPPATASSSPRLPCLGLASKADVGDLRESPIAVIERLQETWPRPAPGSRAARPDAAPRPLWTGANGLGVAGDRPLLLTGADYRHQEFRNVDPQVITAAKY